MQEYSISENQLEQCLKCNLCSSVCPMMEVNPLYPGPKRSGPDSQRYRLKDPGFFDKSLKYCLNCKRCEVACPSGVAIGDIIQIARLKYGSPSRPLRDRILSSTDFMGSIASPMAPIVNGMLRFKPAKVLMHGVMGVDKTCDFPSYSQQKFTSWFDESKQEGYKRHVSYFHGCYVNYNNPQQGKDFVRLMNACLYGVHLLEGERCCGVALISNGFKKKAIANARANIESIGKAAAKGETVLSTSSTCAFTIRDEYGSVLGLPGAEKMKDSVLLAVKWLYDKVESGEIKLVFRQDYHKKIAYHTPCHMNRLGWGIYSTQLLRMIPGVELVELERNCCGIAGTFGFKKENRGFSVQIGKKLFDDIASAAPELVATDCETCRWQIEMNTGCEVRNPISILAEALDYEKTQIANGKK